MSPSPCLLHGVDSLTLSHFHTQHSGLLPCTHCLHFCVSICVHMCVGGGGEGSRSGTMLSQSPTQRPHAHMSPQHPPRHLLSLKVSLFPRKRMAVASLCAWPPSHVGVGVCKRGCVWDYTCEWVCVGGTTLVYGCVWGVYLVAPSPIVFWRSVWYSVG